ncbi:MAG: EamA family transporter RarD [Anaerolineae bacterium]|nr:MAG: EamA family transporter RarD [Anaerolineae bacterium]
MKKGSLIAAVAYVIWGILPIYWHALSSVTATEILMHRIVWSALFCVLLMAAMRDWGWLREGFRRPAIFGHFLVTALLLATNWLIYIWANNNGHIVETSLGYFIIPLVTAVLGLVILRERLRPGQWLSLTIATAGVAYLVLNADGWLWIAFALAFSFGFYGLLRKTAPWGSLHGLTVEMGILFVPALIYLFAGATSHAVAFGTQNTMTTLMLAFSGVVTAVPLLFFASGARQVPLTTLGVLQYIAPTMQFIIGVFVYNEPFSHSSLIGFGIVWVALAIYWIEGYRTYRRQRQTALAAS